MAFLKNKRIIFFLLLPIVLVVLFNLINFESYKYVNVNTGQTATGYRYFSWVLSRDVQENQISIIYLANNPAPLESNFHHLQSKSILGFITAGPCRCYSTHNYYELLKLAAAFDQYEQDFKQPYPKDKQIALAKEAIEVYSSKLKGFTVHYEQGAITLKPIN